DRLAVLEAENTREIVLGELALLPQRLDPGADKGRHPSQFIIAKWQLQALIAHAPDARPSHIGAAGCKSSDMAGRPPSVRESGCGPTHPEAPKLPAAAVPRACRLRQFGSAAFYSTTLESEMVDLQDAAPFFIEVFANETTVTLMRRRFRT